MKFIALSLLDVVFIMPIVGILIFMSRINSCSAELSIKKLYNLRGPGHRMNNKSGSALE